MNPVRLQRGLDRGPPAPLGLTGRDRRGAPRSNRLNWPGVSPTLGPRIKILVSPPCPQRRWGMWTRQGLHRRRAEPGRSRQSIWSRAAMGPPPCGHSDLLGARRPGRRLPVLAVVAGAIDCTARPPLLTESALCAHKELQNTSDAQAPFKGRVKWGLNGGARRRLRRGRGKETASRAPGTAAGHLPCHPFEAQSDFFSIKKAENVNTVSESTRTVSNYWVRNDFTRLPSNARLRAGNRHFRGPVQK